MKNQSLATALPENLAAHLTDGTPADVAALYASLPARAAAADFGIFDNNVVVIDTETTGLDRESDELMQIAAARVEGGRAVDWFVTFVNPGTFIPDDVMRLTGITETDLIGAPSPAEACAALVRFVGDATLVAHNAAFDRGQITKHAEAEILKDNLWIDTLDLARIALPRLQSFRLIDLAKAFGTAEGTHRADADVASTCELLRILLAAVDALPDDALCVIAGLADRDVWPTGEVFAHFARRHLAAKGKSFDAAENRLANEDFSLRYLRRERVRALPQRRPKVDAAVKEENAALSNAAKGSGPVAAAFAAAVEAARAAGAGFTEVPPLEFATSAEIRAAFAPDGLVGSLYDDYEVRSEQLEMALAVNKAFATSENLAVEAGTGVGKSMAYLVPALLAAKKSNITMGVATKTNALLDQLVFHELPALAAGMEARGEDPVTFAALKGIAHYPCLHKIDALVNRGIRVVENDDGEVQSSAPGVAALLTFVLQSGYDDADNLHFDPRLVSRYEYTSSSNECLRRKCPYFGSGCFGHGARRAAENVDIVVTNHALLFADVEADGGLLPPIRYWVVDEAHGAEEEAREAFAVELRSDELLRLAERCAGDDAQRNVFRRAARRVPAAKGSADKAIAAAQPFADAVRAYTHDVKCLKRLCQGRQGARAVYGEAVWLSGDTREQELFRSVAQSGKLVMKLAEPVLTATTEVLSVLAAAEADAEVQNEVGVFSFDMRDMIGAADVVFGVTDLRYVYSVVVFQKSDRMQERLNAQVIDVGAHLNETFYRRTHAVVFTSATLMVGGSFDAFERAMGLNTSDWSSARTLSLSSGFDFDRNMVIYVPTDMPEYSGGESNETYLRRLSCLLRDVHLATRGGLLTLFASRADLEACYEAVQPALDEAGLVLERQRPGSSFKALRENFLSNRDSSLFGLKAFWAGFDAPGETLRGVIIPKLPFAQPNDPLSKAREEIEGSGYEAWRKYSLSAAVIDTRQAVGRLIRKADDRGIIILGDSRILSKGYGKTVLNSMPSHTVCRLTCAEIAEDIRRRFPEWQR